MADAKLTAAQKNEIFHRAIFDGLSDAQLSEEYGVCRKTIYRITHDRKRIERKRSTLETMRELAKLRVMASAERAAQKQIGGRAATAGTSATRWTRRRTRRGLSPAGGRSSRRCGPGNCMYWRRWEQYE